MENMFDDLIGGEKHEWDTCPMCKAPWDIEKERYLDSDNITPVEELEPEARAALSCYACYHVYECRACEGMYYFVDVAVVRNPEISEGFRHCFFWRNGGEADFVTGETETALSIGKSGGFITEKTPTTEGDLYRYYIGPFVPKDIGLGEHAVLFYD
jgi:hypothetical protein